LELPLLVEYPVEEVVPAILVLEAKLLSEHVDEGEAKDTRIVIHSIANELASNNDTDGPVVQRTIVSAFIRTLYQHVVIPVAIKIRKLI
jgi:hypothetical protein